MNFYSYRFLFPKQMFSYLPLNAIVTCFWPNTNGIANENKNSDNDNLCESTLEIVCLMISRLCIKDCDLLLIRKMRL